MCKVRGMRYIAGYKVNKSRNMRIGAYLWYIADNKAILKIRVPFEFATLWLAMLIKVDSSEYALLVCINFFLYDWIKGARRLERSGWNHVPAVECSRQCFSCHSNSLHNLCNCSKFLSTQRWLRYKILYVRRQKQCLNVHKISLCKRQKKDVQAFYLLTSLLSVLISE